MVVAQRREALTSVVLGIGTIGLALCITADVIKPDAQKSWEACMGQRPKSFSSYVGEYSQLAFLLAVAVGVTRSKRAFRVMLTSRLFMPWKTKRGFRSKIIIPFVGSGVCLYYMYLRVQEALESDRHNQRCAASFQDLRARQLPMSEWQYSQGGLLGFASTVCASAFFILHDVRKRQREKARRRYYSSNYYGEDIDEGDSSDDAEGNVELDDMRTR